MDAILSMVRARLPLAAEQTHVQTTTHSQWLPKNSLRV
jgi:hypothetical protein